MLMGDWDEAEYMDMETGIPKLGDNPGMELMPALQQEDIGDPRGCELIPVMCGLKYFQIKLGSQTWKLYLKVPKGLSKGEKKSIITEPLFFFDLADSFLLRV